MIPAFLVVVDGTAVWMVAVAVVVGAWCGFPSAVDSANIVGDETILLVRLGNPLTEIMFDPTCLSQ